MIFYDFEVFKYDWLVVLIDMQNQEKTTIVNNPGELLDFYNAHKTDIWVGYNNKRYDQYILQGILCGFNPKEINDFIIENDMPGYRFSPLLKEFSFINYDVMDESGKSLKWLEGSMGNNIKESSVPFDIDRRLNRTELEETIEYCTSDVENTIEVFMKISSDFNAHLQLIKMYKMPLSYLSRTKVQLSAEILDAARHEWNDEFDIHLPPTMKVYKYKCVPEWFMNPENHHYKNKNDPNQLKIMMGGIEVVFGWGGVHGAIPNYHSEGYFVNMDVGSLYPTLDCLYSEYCFTRSVSKEGLQRYKDILKYRLELKAQGKKKEQAPYKIVLNGTYGAMKDKYNKLYDPRGANNTCVFGQLLVGVDLFEKIEPYAEIIQINTDGILIRKPDKYTDVDEWFNKIDDIAHEWEQRTGLSLEFDDYGFGEVYQKDVNNYVIVDGYDGSYKSKGEYVKKLSDLDYDLPILNKALINAMVHKIPVEQTINECNDLFQFQMVKKISRKYDAIYYGNYELKERCVRVFASKYLEDRGIYKLHSKTGCMEKMEGTPLNCFIDNGDMDGKPVPVYLDKDWYIYQAKKRLEGFGS